MEEKANQQSRSGFSFSNPLLLLKMSFALTYATNYCTLPYMALLPTKIVSFSHIAMVYSCIPLLSSIGPIVVGLVADRYAIHKQILLFSVILFALPPFGVLWLYNDHQSYQQTPLFSNDTEHSALEDPHTYIVEKSYTFPLLMAFRLLGYFSGDSWGNMLDVCGLTLTKELGGDFARQKLWGPLTMMVVPFVGGLLIDLYSDHLGYIDFSIVFYLGGIMSLCSIPPIMKIKMKTEKNHNSVMTTARKVVGMIDLDFFILLEIVVGICYGFHQDFLPVFIHSDFVASKTMMGLVLSVNGLGTIVVLFLGKIIINRLGEAHSVMIGLLLYSARFMIFYYIENPWILLATEFFEGFSGYLPIVAGSYYCAAESPPGMLAALNGIVYGAIYGIGRGLGMTIGSSLISNYSIRTTYIYFSYMAGASAVVYFILHHLFLKKIRSERTRKRNEALNEGAKEVFGIDNPVVELIEESDTIQLTRKGIEGTKEVFGIDNPVLKLTEEDDTIDKMREKTEEAKDVAAYNLTVEKTEENDTIKKTNEKEETEEELNDSLTVNLTGESGTFQTTKKENEGNQGKA